MLHPGKRDWWIAAILLTAALGLLGGGTFLTGLGLVEGPLPATIAGLSLLATGLMIGSVYTSTNYEITDDRLIVRSGPFRWRIVLADIEEVVPSGWSGGGGVIEWNFGLAVQGLYLRYRKKSGGLTFPIRIAPVDRSAFLLELLEKAPHLEVGVDGALRTKRDATPARIASEG